MMQPFEKADELPGNESNWKLPFWSGAAIAASTVIVIESLRQFQILVPIPFLWVLVAVVLSANRGGLAAGITGAIVWGVYVIYGAIASLEPKILTGTPVSVTVGIVTVSLLAWQLGRNKDQNDRLTTALHIASTTLEQQVAERTAALISANTQLQREIEERQQLAVQFLECTAELQAIADNAEDFIVRFDRQLRHCFVNRALTVAAGISHENYLGKTNEELGMPAKLCNYWNCHLQDVFQTGQPKAIEFEYETINGWRSFQSKIVPERWESGSVKTLLAITRDITQHKQIEKELTQLLRREQVAHTEAKVARQRLANTLESISDAFVALDREWRYTYVNQRAGQLFNRRPQELVGKNIWEEFPEAVGQTFYHAYYRAVREQTFIQLEEYYPPWDRWFENRIYPTADGISIFFQEVTDRKRVEAALRTSEARLQYLISTTPGVIYTCEASGNYDATYVSDNVSDALGYEPQEFYNEPGFWVNRLHPEDVSDVFAKLPKLFTENQLILEHRILHKDGTYRWIDDRCRLVRDEEGNPKEIIGCFLDMSDRKVAEEALRESEEKFRQLAETIHEVFYIYSINSNQLLYISPAYEQLWGRSCESLYQEPDSWLEAIHPEDRDRVNEAFRQRYESEESYQEYRIIRPDGSLRWIFDRYFSVVAQDSQLYRFLGVAEDITERKQVELALQQLNQELENRVKARTSELEQSQEILRQREQEVRTLVENSPDVIARFDRQLRHLYINQAITQASGLSPEAFIGKTLSELGMPADCIVQCEAAMRHVFQTGEQVDIEIKFSTLDGVRWFQTRYAPEWNASGEVVTILEISREITAYKQAELARRESQQQLQAILDNSPAIIYVSDIQDRLLLINRQYENLFNITNEQIVGKHINEIWSPEIADAFIANNREVLERGTAIKQEEVAPHEDGLHTYITVKFPLYNIDGVPYAVCGISTDITERKKAEVELRESEEKFRQLAETIDEVFFLNSGDGQQMLYISPGYEKIWGRSCQSLYEQPRSWLDAIHPEDHNRVLRAFIHHLQTYEDFHEVFRLVQPDGTIRWVCDRSSFVLNDAGEPYRLAGIAQDITERQLAEQELEKSQRFIQRIADASPNILYVYDLQEQRNIYTNRSIGSILGYTPAEIQEMGSKLISHLMHPDDIDRHSEYQQRIKAAADGDTLDIEYRIRHGRGEWRWLHSRVMVFTRAADGAVKQIIGAAEDISTRKQTEAQLKASLAEKEVLLREIHHRVKNNLNVIYSLLNMQARTIQDNFVKNVLLDSQKRLQTMALIHEQLYHSESLAQIDFAEYIHRLTSNLFAASNLNHNLIQIEIRAEPVALNLETAIPCGLVINELLTNAFKYAFPNGQSGTIYIEFYQDRDDILHLSISDNGVGIPSNLDLQRTSSLGMRLVQILVQQLRSTFEIDRSHGTRFNLTFSRID